MASDMQDQRLGQEDPPKVSLRAMMKNPSMIVRLS